MTTKPDDKIDLGALQADVTKAQMAYDVARRDYERVVAATADARRRVADVWFAAGHRLDAAILALEEAKRRP